MKKEKREFNNRNLPVWIVIDAFNKIKLLTNEKLDAKTKKKVERITDWCLKG